MGTHGLRSQEGPGPASANTRQDLSFNSFEQLCINYANENLQYLFNKIVFQEEQVLRAPILTGQWASLGTDRICSFFKGKLEIFS